LRQTLLLSPDVVKQPDGRRDQPRTTPSQVRAFEAEILALRHQLQVLTPATASVNACRSHALGLGLAHLVRVADNDGVREARDGHRLASAGLSSLLGVEISTSSGPPEGELLKLGIDVSQARVTNTFMQHDFGYFDDETCRLEPIENPFGPKLLPMSPE
jgi:hypothetical protein